MSRFRGVLFDFDGTLFDSAPDIAWCANRIREEEGDEALPVERVRAYIGDGSERLLHRCLTDDLEGEVPEARYRRARDRFFELYLDNLTTRSSWFPHAPDLLGRLAERGTPVGLVTNKPERFTLPLLETLAVDGCFASVVCGDTLSVKKPDPEPLAHAARHAGVDPDECVMVGDSLIDLTAARAAGMHAIFVTHGYCRDIDATAARADQVCDSLQAVEAALSL